MVSVSAASMTKCTKCNAEYQGKTERILSIQISEHKNGKNSASFQQINRHLMVYENMQVINAGSTDTKLRVHI